MTSFLEAPRAARYCKFLNDEKIVKITKEDIVLFKKLTLLWGNQRYLHDAPALIRFIVTVQGCHQRERCRLSGPRMCTHFGEMAAATKSNIIIRSDMAS